VNAELGKKKKPGGAVTTHGLRQALPGGSGAKQINESGERGQGFSENHWGCDLGLGRLARHEEGPDRKGGGRYSAFDGGYESTERIQEKRGFGKAVWVVGKTLECRDQKIKVVPMVLHQRSNEARGNHTSPAENTWGNGLGRRLISSEKEKKNLDVLEIVQLKVSLVCGQLLKRRAMLEQKKQIDEMRVGSKTSRLRERNSDSEG